MDMVAANIMIDGYTLTGVGQPVFTRAPAPVCKVINNSDSIYGWGKTTLTLKSVLEHASRNP